MKSEPGTLWKFQHFLDPDVFLSHFFKYIKNYFKYMIHWLPPSFPPQKDCYSKLCRNLEQYMFVTNLVNGASVTGIPDAITKQTCPDCKNPYPPFPQIRAYTVCYGIGNKLEVCMVLLCFYLLESILQVWYKHNC